METKLILHRGYKGTYLENSKTAFIHAIKEGHFFETDIRVSRDKVPYLIHDETLDRLYNGTGEIAKKTTQELSKYQFKEDSNEKICTFNELCQMIESADKKDSLIFIHIKELKDIEPVLNVLKNYNFKDRIRFFAVDELTLPFLHYIKKNASNYQVGLHVPEDSIYIDEEHFSHADFIWADEITKKNITKEMVELAHRLGKPVYTISPELIPESIFNANIQQRWEEMIQVGVDGICSDMPTQFSDFEETQ